MHLAIITAGGAGMFCGSCMHDNTWARALHEAGTEVSLIPLYTPIRVDEKDFTSAPIFFGGINIYLNDRFSFWKYVPKFMKRWLDSPAVIRLATRRAVGNDASELGRMTVSMLMGDQGPHRLAGEELTEYVVQLKPDAVFFSNSLLSGTLPTLRKKYAGKIYCVLQGDDVFLDGLIEPYRMQAMSALKQQVSQFDGFVTHSQFYQDYMRKYLDLNSSNFLKLPLAIDCSQHDGLPKENLGCPPTIGYFARICREKGLDLLVRSVLELRESFPDIRLKVGGYLGAQNLAYFDEVKQLAAPLGDAFNYIGSPPTHADKVSFFKSIDVFSVPARFQEPKGLYVLEAWANGVPVVLPNHAAFPELIESTGGGLLGRSDDSSSLTDALRRILQDQNLRWQLANSGYQRVRTKHDLRALADETRRALSAT